MIKRFEDFIGYINVIYRNIEKIKRHRMKEFGLSGNHVMYMTYLAHNPEGLTAAELCQLTSVDKAATSRALSELVEKGFVYYPDLEGSKKYRATAVLTESGFEISEKMNEIIQELVEQVARDMSEEEGRNLYGSLEKISGRIEQIAKDC